MDEKYRLQWMADERKWALECAARVRYAREMAREKSRQGQEWACGYWYDEVAKARREEREHIHNYYCYKRGE